jgi:hypothetical protein
MNFGAPLLGDIMRVDAAISCFLFGTYHLPFFNLVRAFVYKLVCLSLRYKQHQMYICLFIFLPSFDECISQGCNLFVVTF